MTLKQIQAATVVITTKNRRDELREAVGSCLKQTVPIEVLVLDDGSADGTADMIRKDFPSVRLHREETSRGLIVRRNQGARMASGEIVFSIDDDAAFSADHIVADTLDDFDNPRIGAVAIPFVNVNQNSFINQRSPNPNTPFISDAYIGTAHAVRKKLFLKLGGYREHFIHQGEEGDFCIRMLDAGYVVRLGRSDPIFHFESPRRDFRRMDFYGRRNDILFAWHNVPLAALPVHLAATTAQGTVFALRIRRPRHMILGLLNGYADCCRFWKGRNPVSLKVFKLFRRLKKNGPISLSEVEEYLPPMRYSWGCEVERERPIP